MKYSPILHVFVLGLLTAFALAQGPSGQRDQFPSQTTPPTFPPDQTEPEKPSPGPQPPDTVARTPAMDDKTLESWVREQLATKPAFSAIVASVLNAVVTLEGTVRSQEEENRARKVAESVPGVKRVVSKLTIQGPEGNGPAGQQATKSTDETQVGVNGKAPSRAGSIAGNTEAASGMTTGSSEQISAGVPLTSEEVKQQIENKLAKLLVPLRHTRLAGVIVSVQLSHRRKAPSAVTLGLQPLSRHENWNNMGPSS